MTVILIITDLFIWIALDEVAIPEAALDISMQGWILPQTTFDFLKIHLSRTW